ncbi:hypothetical protein CC86DRAFT_432867 [Ophiobolus disseminans]|uniref:Uncharacterized protein n=1 Tax=Ophiobolus disseminans TaxID=1469910 RepID=A0A6A6ZEQ3_9PLEO|nr:hypothetical protein CC86DRAFT_432867 [Ophiobolus disseminans]
MRIVRGRFLWQHGNGHDMKSVLNIGIHDSFFDALRTRKATDPREMSFGLHSVLQRCLQGSAALSEITSGDTVKFGYGKFSVYFDATSEFVEPTAACGSKELS